MKALADEGYTVPTPIQAQAIPHLLLGRDLLGCAQTGTGKTAAFALPLLDRLMQRRGHEASPRGGNRHGAPRHPQVLVLAPTRELATQIVDSFTAYGRHTGVRTLAIYGGVSQVHQVKALRDGVDVLVATPGRLIDLMQQRVVTLSAVSALVLDEADRMLDMGFIAPIRRIVAALPSQRQTLLFSATLPDEIRRLAREFLRDPVTVTVAPISSLAPKIEQALYRVADRAHKMQLLERLLESADMSRTVVFARTKHGADRIARRLIQQGISADAIHGNKAQNRRQRTLDRFRTGALRVLVATDVAARGLDVDGVTHVVNFDLSVEPEAHVHRIGRTGRAGATGIAISFCDRDEIPLLRSIERLTRVQLPECEVPSDLAAAPQALEARSPREQRPSREPRNDSRDSGSGGRGQRRRSQGRATSPVQHGSSRHHEPVVSARPTGIAMRGRGTPRGRSR